MENVTWPKWTKYTAVGVILIAFLAGFITLIADVGASTEDPAEIRKIENDRKDSSLEKQVADSKVTPKDTSDDKKDPEWQKKFDKAIELMKSGMYNEAITLLADVQINTKSANLKERSTLFHGIALLERGLRHDEEKDLHLAREKLEEMLSNFSHLPEKYTAEFTAFLLTMSKLERQFSSSNAEIIPHLENLLIYHDGETKGRLHAELGFQYYNQCDLKRAMQYFRSSKSNLADLGIIKVYKAQNDFSKAKEQCETRLNSYKSDPLYSEFVCNCVCDMPSAYRVGHIECGDLPNVTCQMGGVGCTNAKNTTREAELEIVQSKSGCNYSGCKSTTKTHSHKPRATKSVSNQVAEIVEIEPVGVITSPVISHAQRYVVISGAFTSVSGAEEMAVEASKLGVPSWVEPDPSANIFRVVSRTQYNRSEANRLATLLRNRNISDAYVAAR